MKLRIKKASLALLITLFVNAGLVCMCAFAFNSDFAGTICSVSITLLWLLYVVGFCRKKA